MGWIRDGETEVGIVWNADKSHIVLMHNKYAFFADSDSHYLERDPDCCSGGLINIDHIVCSGNESDNTTDWLCVYQCILLIRRSRIHILKYLFSVSFISFSTIVSIKDIESCE